MRELFVYTVVISVATTRIRMIKGRIFDIVMKSELYLMDLSCREVQLVVSIMQGAVLHEHFLSRAHIILLSLCVFLPPDLHFIMHIIGSIDRTRLHSLD